MSKKITAILFAALALCATSCTPSHEHCGWGDVNYCDDDYYAMRCDPSTRTWKETYCEFGCIEYGADAYCATGTTPQLPTEGCGDVPAKGACFGDIVARCDTKTDTLITRDCSLKSKTCGLSIDHYDCVDGSSSTSPSQKYKEGEACGSKVNEAGLCDGNTLVYCDGGTQHLVKCSDSCAVGASGRADCVSKYAEGDACGNITNAGICDNNMLVYCDDSKKTLHVETCADGCVADAEKGIRANCYRSCPVGRKVGAEGRTCLDDLTGYQECDANLGLVTVICQDFRGQTRTCTTGTDGYLGCHH